MVLEWMDWSKLWYLLENGPETINVWTPDGGHRGVIFTVGFHHVLYHTNWALRSFNDSGKTTGKTCVLLDFKGMKSLRFPSDLSLTIVLASEFGLISILVIITINQLKTPTCIQWLLLSGFFFINDDIMKTEIISFKYICLDMKWNSNTNERNLVKTFFFLQY